MTEYDYIVVGGGIGLLRGGRRLTQDAGTRVPPLEAGSAERTRAMTVPDAWPQLLGTPAGLGLPHHRPGGRGAGGLPRGPDPGRVGAINAMRTCAGTWGWSTTAGPRRRPWRGFADLAAVFRRRSSTTPRDPALRGTEGPVRGRPGGQADRIQSRAWFAEALPKYPRLPVTDDLSGPPAGGRGRDHGHRRRAAVSPADAYLRPVLHRPNLTVEVGPPVTRRRASTAAARVSATPATGRRPRRRPARGDRAPERVGSPKLLMLSGIGPAGRGARSASTRWLISPGSARTSRTTPWSRRRRGRVASPRSK